MPSTAQCQLLKNNIFTRVITSLLPPCVIVNFVSIYSSGLTLIGICLANMSDIIICRDISSFLRVPLYNWVPLAPEIVIFRDGIFLSCFSESNHVSNFVA